MLLQLGMKRERVICLDMCREEKPTRCHWMVYCTYNMLNVFRALLCSSSGAETICVLLPPMVCSAWLLVIRGQVQCSRLCVQEEGCCITWVMQHPSSWMDSLLPFTWPPTTSNQALHTIGGNNTYSLQLLCPKQGTAVAQWLRCCATNRKVAG